MESNIDESSHFRVVQQFDANYAPTKFTMYESLRTGMRVVVIDQEGPKVCGNFVLATEIFDDSGAPHTLEHLCFMGSKTYPYKGVLDKLATRAYSNTNAWTSVDHTAYSLDAAGWEGFAQILPIYLEHILFPTLTDAACYTEVHHIDGEGQDAGVVYSEMQGEQNKIGEKVELELKRLLYPEGVGFRYETGGMMEQLRVLTPDRIRDFHKSMYQSRNFCLILLGSIDHKHLIKILDTFESMNIEHIPSLLAPFRRPWIESQQAPPLQKSLVVDVNFPEDDETISEMAIVFEGPAYEESTEIVALEVLLRYLSGSPASVLINVMVEKEKIASGIYYQSDLRPRMLIRFFLGGIATERLHMAKMKFEGLLIDTANRDLDMQYLKDCARIKKRGVKVLAETSADCFIEPAISDFLFGNRDGTTLKNDLETLDDFDIVEQWEESRWKALLRTWLIDAPSITINGIPSARLADDISEHEEARIASRRQQLGERGLQDLARRLELANSENEKPIPDALRESFDIPNPRNIHFIQTQTALAGAARKLNIPVNAIQEIIDKDISDDPLFIQFEHVKSSFALINILMTITHLPLELRPLLSVYMESFFSAPMLRQGRKIGFETVLMELERDTVDRGMTSGCVFGSSESICLSLQVDSDEYCKGVDWIQRLVFDSVLDLERIEATVARLAAEIPEEKREGDEMVNAVNLMITRAPESLSRARSTLVRAVYLKRVRRMLENDPQTLLVQLQQIKDILFRPTNLRVMIVADVKRLENPVTAWRTLTRRFDANAGDLEDLESQRDRLSAVGKRPADALYIIPMPSIDSSYLHIDTTGPKSYHDPDVPALMVAIAFLNAVEGPIWTAVRGAGLAYDARIEDSIDSGLVSLSISSSPDAYKAFIACKSLVSDFLNGTTPVEKIDMEGAISSIVLNFANAEDTVARAAIMSITRQMIRGLPKDWPTIVLSRVRDTTAKEMLDAMARYIMPLFDSATTVVVVTCAPIMADKLQENFMADGYPAEIRKLASFYDDYGYYPGTEDEDSTPEEDEDEEEWESEDGDETVEDDYSGHEVEGDINAE